MLCNEGPAVHSVDMLNLEFNSLFGDPAEHRRAKILLARLQPRLHGWMM